jgi:hypothetical protein
MYNRNYNILPFLCNLLQYATDENFDPVIVEPPVFDITPFTDFTGLTAVGDPRVSLGEAMSATFIEFLPRMITQTEVLQAGGTQVIDSIICTADGQPIKQSQTVPILLSLDLTGKKPYQYGALTVPPTNATLEQLMKPIDPQEVIDYTKTYIDKAKSIHADDFVKFVNAYFLQSTRLWKPELIAFQTPPLFLVKLNEYEDSSYKTIKNTVYIKYYYDVKDYVGCNIGVDSIQTYITSTAIDNNAMVIAIGVEIPNYQYLMQNLTKADEWYEYLINNTFTNTLSSYKNLFDNTDAANAYMQEYLKMTTPVMSSIDVNCNY